MPLRNKENKKISFPLNIQLIAENRTQGFYSPDKSEFKEYSRSFPGLIYLFSTTDLGDANMKNINIPG